MIAAELHTWTNMQVLAIALSCLAIGMNVVLMFMIRKP